MAWLYAPFRSDIAIVEGRGAVGPSGTLSSMDAAMSPMDGFTRVPLGPAAPRPSR
jgi:hypothetical protein